MGTAGRARTSKRQCAPSPLPCLIGPALPLVSRSNPSQLPPPLCWGVPLGRNRTRWAAIILCLSQKDRIDGITPPPDTHTHTDKRRRNPASAKPSRLAAQHGCTAISGDCCTKQFLQACPSNPCGCPAETRWHQMQGVSVVVAGDPSCGALSPAQGPAALSAGSFMLIIVGGSVPTL